MPIMYNGNEIETDNPRKNILICIHNKTRMCNAHIFEDSS